MEKGQDTRDLIFRKVERKKYLAHISVQGEGVFSGAGWLKKACKNLKIDLKNCKEKGIRIRPSEIVATLEGSARRMAMGEEELVGWVSKASGIATAAWKARKAAGRNLKVVSGAWKKMPVEIVDIGQAIIDAPLLDMRLDITAKL